MNIACRVCLPSNACIHLQQAAPLQACTALCHPPLEGFVGDKRLRSTSLSPDNHTEFPSRILLVSSTILHIHHTER